MEQANNYKSRRHKGKQAVSTGGSSGAVYGLGLIGSVIYFFQQAVGFGAFVTGFLKALVWPAFVVHRLLEFLKM